MKTISADYIFVEGQWKADKVIHVGDAGDISHLSDRSGTTEVDIALRGCIIPGFVNAHCHLELTHMQGLIPTGTGLVDFIFGVFSQREFAAEEIVSAATQGDRQMYQAGIDAVGDICNTLHSQQAKLDSPIRYASFVEAYDLYQGQEDNALWESHLATYDGLECKPGDYKSLVPHAGYSVSPEAFAKISQINTPHQHTVSIHNQETPDENLFFLEGKGDLRHFYKQAKLPLTHYQPTGSSALEYNREHLDAQRKTLMVHNTMTTGAEIQETLHWNPQTYWVTCPNANLYIENRLPDYAAWCDNQAKIAIGTDGACSNWGLSVWSEIQTIARYQSGIPVEELLTWGTANGADALGFDDLGRIRPGGRCGLLALNFFPEREKQLGLRHKVDRICF